MLCSIFGFRSCHVEAKAEQFSLLLHQKAKHNAEELHFTHYDIIK